MPYIGNSNANKNKAALIAILRLGFYSLAIDLALGINSQASKEVLEDKIRTSTGDRKSLYQNALNKLKLKGHGGKVTSYPKGLGNAIKELADSAREVPLGFQQRAFRLKIQHGLKGNSMDWVLCFLPFSE